MNRTKGILVLLSGVIFQSGICGQQTLSGVDGPLGEDRAGGRGQAPIRIATDFP